MESSIKKRSLKFHSEFTPDRLNAASEALEEIDGIIQVNEKSVDKLSVEYDLMKVNLVKIEKTLEILELSLSRSIGQKFKRGWINFMEENEAKNLRAVPVDCCAPPKK